MTTDQDLPLGLPVVPLVWRSKSTSFSHGERVCFLFDNLVRCGEPPLNSIEPVVELKYTSAIGMSSLRAAKTAPETVAVELKSPLCTSRSFEFESLIVIITIRKVD
jgi:hypothetical protein